MMNEVEKFNWFSLITPRHARFILDNLETEFNRFAYIHGWELSDEAKTIIVSKLQKIAGEEQ